MDAPDKPLKVRGVLETCLYVADTFASRDFYARVFGLKPMLSEERICTLDAGPRQVLILFRRGGTLQPVPIGAGFIPPHDAVGPQHFAFAIASAEYERWKGHLLAAGVAVESEVVWPQGGRSIYFRDPDGHLGELATRGLWENYP